MNLWTYPTKNCRTKLDRSGIQGFDLVHRVRSPESGGFGDDGLSEFELGESDRIPKIDYRDFSKTAAIATLDPFTQWNFLRPAIPWPHVFDQPLGIRDEALAKKISSHVQSLVAPQIAPDEFWSILSSVYPDIEINLWDLTDLCLVGHIFQKIDQKKLICFLSSQPEEAQFRLRRLGDNGETTTGLFFAYDQQDKNWTSVVPHGWELLLPSGYTLRYESSELIQTSRDRFWAAPHPANIQIFLRFAFAGVEGFSAYDNGKIEAATKDYWLHDWATVWGGDTIDYEPRKSFETVFEYNCTDYDYDFDANLLLDTPYLGLGNNSGFDCNLGFRDSPDYDEDFELQDTAINNESFGPGCSIASNGFFDPDYTPAGSESSNPEYTLVGNGFYLDADLSDNSSFDAECTITGDDSFDSECTLVDNDSFDPECTLVGNDSFDSECTLVGNDSFDSECTLVGNDSFDSELTLVANESFDWDLKTKNQFGFDLSTTAGKATEAILPDDQNQNEAHNNGTGSSTRPENDSESGTVFRPNTTFDPGIILSTGSSIKTRGVEHENVYTHPADDEDHIVRSPPYPKGQENHIGKKDNVSRNWSTIFKELDWSATDEVEAGETDYNPGPVSENEYHYFGGQDQKITDSGSAGYETYDFIFSTGDKNIPGGFYNTFLKAPDRSCPVVERAPKRKYDETRPQKKSEYSDDSDDSEYNPADAKRGPYDSSQLISHKPVAGNSLPKRHKSWKATPKRKAERGELEELPQAKRKREASPVQSSRKRKLEDDGNSGPRKRLHESQDEASIAAACADAFLNGLEPSSGSRVPNCFILFRTWYSRSKIPSAKRKTIEISRAAGTAWRKLSPIQRQMWIEQSSNLRIAQRRLYPDYQYNTPKTNGIKRRRKIIEETLQLPLNKRIKLSAVEPPKKHEASPGLGDRVGAPAPEQPGTVRRKKDLVAERRRNRFLREKMHREELGILFDGNPAPEIKIFQYQPQKLLWRPKILAKVRKPSPEAPVKPEKDNFQKTTSPELPKPELREPKENTDEEYKTPDSSVVVLKHSPKKGFQDEDISQAFYTHWDTMDTLTLDQLLDLGGENQCVQTLSESKRKGEVPSLDQCALGLVG
ncbi:hypothetical protein TWF718_003168 [Orbilia javanica]|uniref:HMG box domain-containing protein n=1 Tax=Orbilia javanica TaxID=47235 RepID=A0AAN8NLI4_9PEZI